jgi:hypothetical protein
MKLTRTRFTKDTGIWLAKTASGWQHAEVTEREDHAPIGRPVGPTYKTQTEALADHEAYLKRAGWLKEDEPDAHAQLMSALRDAYAHAALLGSGQATPLSNAELCEKLGALLPSGTPWTVRPKAPEPVIDPRTALETVAALAFNLGHEWARMHSVPCQQIMDHVKGSFGLYGVLIDWGAEFDKAWAAKPEDQRENFLEDIDTFYGDKLAELKTAAGCTEV